MFTAFDPTSVTRLERLHRSVQAGTANSPEHLEKASAFDRETDELEAQLNGALAGSHSITVDETGVHCHADNVSPEWEQVTETATISSPDEHMTDLVSVAECALLIKALNGGAGFVKAEAIAVFDWAHAIRVRRCLLEWAAAGHLVIDASVTPIRFHPPEFAPDTGVAA